MSCLAAQPAISQVDNAAVYHLNRAINNLANEDVERAAEHFEAAREADADSPEINLKIGELYIEYTEDGYRKALPYLVAALDSDPELRRARLLVGLSYFNQERYPESTDALEPLLGDADFGDHALYYLGIIDFRQRKYDQAGERLQSILSIEEADNLHESARKYLESIKIATKRWSFYGKSALRYDSNPQILPDLDVADSNLFFDRRKDHALIITGQGSYTPYRTESMEARVVYQLYDVRYERLSRLDQQGHTLRLGSTFRVRGFKNTLDYALEHWFVDGDGLQRAHRVSASSARRLTSTSETSLRYQLSHLNRFDDSKRSGLAQRFSADHVNGLPGGWRLALGYDFRAVDTDAHADSRRNGLSAAIHAPRFYRFDTQLKGRHEFTNYSGGESTPSREDERKTSLSATIVRALTRHLQVHLRIGQETNRSDDDNFTYDRFQADIGLVAYY